MVGSGERLFLALTFPERVRETLGELVEARPGFRWVPAGNRHLTLKFIGTVAEEERERMVERLAKVSVRSFPVTLGGVGTFPEAPAPPKVVWTGVLRAHPHLFALHKRIDDTLFRMGVAPDTRRYRPHATIARVGDAPPESVAQYVKARAGFEAPPVFAESFALVRSELSGGAPRHTRLRTFPLETVCDRRRLGHGE